MIEISNSKKYNVVVIRRREIKTFPTLATPKIQVQVSYVGGGLPPTTIAIPKDEHTKAEEIKRIREDLERRLKDKPESFTV